MKRPSTRVSKVLRGLNILAIFLAVAVSTMTVGKVLADSFVQSFNVSGTVKNGWVVSLDKTKSSTVQAASNSSAASVYGVVIDQSQAPVSIQRQAQQVFVATSGNYVVLVSTQNGAIKSGDYLAMSSTKGVAAKAGNLQSFVIGQALATYDGTNGVITTQSDGTKVGQILVDINPGKNPLLQSSATVPEPLRNLSESIAGKPVSALHIYGALAIFLTTAIIAASLLWVGVRSGMVAIGRNPLSRHSIIKSLSQVVVTAVLIFIAGIFGVYLLLRL